jgi:hypothetical protein
MPAIDLRNKYGGSTRMAINRAIRAELAGGNECLDAMELCHKLVRRLGEHEPGGKVPSVAKVAYDRVAGIADAMENEIRRRYNMRRLGEE